MKTTHKAVCKYDDGTQDTATVVITGEGGEVYQVAWEISNGEKDRTILEAASNEEAFEMWCEENGFEPAA